jgi:hypothetical protein
MRIDETKMRYRSRALRPFCSRDGGPAGALLGAMEGGMKPRPESVPLRDGHGNWLQLVNLLSETADEVMPEVA